MTYSPIPYENGCEKELQKISENTLQMLRVEHGLDIKNATAAYTVTTAFLTQIAEYLHNHNNKKIEIGSLISFSTMNRESDSGEKAGNIVVVVELGEQFKLGCKDDGSTEDDE